MELEKVIKGIMPLDEKAKGQAGERQNTLIKPIGSLGKIESLSVQLAGITGDIYSSFDKKAIVVMCADNGVYEEGVSLAPQVVTLSQSLNFQKQITGVGVLSKLSGSALHVVDIGINSDVTSDSFINRKVRKGTANLAKEPAMTRDEVLKAIEIGFEETQKLCQQGYKVIGTGEMGLANTTTASLVIMSLTGRSADEAAGLGTGLTEEQFEHKKQVIKNAYALHKPDPSDPLDVLSKVGGLDIAGLVGVYLAAAYNRLPVVIDGVISAAAALCAYKLCPGARDYMIPSHCSEEPGYVITMEVLQLQPYFHLDMRLGEGTGCPFTFLLIDAAERIIKDMATFAEVNMDSSKLVDIREQDK